MRRITLPISELVTLAYLGALVLALSMVGCTSEVETPPATPVAIQNEVLPPAFSTPAVPAAELEIVTTPIPDPNAPVSFADGEAAYSERDFDTAMALFSRYVEQKPDNAFGHYMLGLSAHKLGFTEDAENALTKAIELDAKHVRSWQNLARVLLDAGRPDEALAAIQEAQSLDPENHVSFRLMGRALHDGDQKSEAADAYREAILRNDKDAWSINNLALVLLEENWPVQASQAFARATQLRPDQALFHNNLGMALERSGQFESARLAYAAASEADPLHLRAQANLERLQATDLANESETSVETLAALFLEEVESWRDEHVARELGEPDLDVASSRTDSTLADVANIR